MSISRRQTATGWAYDVRLRRPDGRQYKRSFPTKKAAVEFEAAERLAVRAGEWLDPAAGQVSFKEYSGAWLTQRSDLRPRTVDLYRWLLAKHIWPGLGQRQLGEIRTAEVREWRADLMAGGLGSSTVAKAYRLLRTILGTALEDGRISKNPCAIRGAGIERTPERPVATLEQVYALAGAVPVRNQALVLLAAFSGMRLGELLALQRERIDLEAGVVHVTESQHELVDRRIVTGPPKTEAGRRTVSIPPHLLPVLAEHLNRWVGPEPDALVFTGDKGGWLRRSQWNSRWRQARQQVGLPQLHFHDLRHTGNTLAAATGASTKELMSRLGHASAPAALRYQHATRERDQAIADALSDMVSEAIGQPRTTPDADECAINAPWGPSEGLNAPSPSDQKAPLTRASTESGRRESNSRSQLGKLMFCR